MQRNLEWIILVTDNYEKSRDFYGKILELEIVREVQKDYFTQFKMENCFLAIYGRKEMEKLVGKKFINSSGGAIYTFKESENIDSEYINLKSKGIIFIKEPVTQSWGQRTAYFLDPDEHIWEIQEWKRQEL